MPAADWDYLIVAALVIVILGAIGYARRNPRRP